MTDLSAEILAIGQGNNVAFDRLYKRESRSLLILATGLVAGDRSAAEDIVDAAMISIWQGAKKYRGQSQAQAYGWLRRILRNKAVDWLRANGRYETILNEGNLVEAPDPLASPEAIAITSDAATRLSKAMLLLSVEQREAVMLCYFEERPVAEIAAIAGCPEGTVKTRLFNARRALRGLLAEPADQPGSVRATGVSPPLNGKAKRMPSREENVPN